MLRHLSCVALLLELIDSVGFVVLDLMGNPFEPRPQIDAVQFDGFRSRYRESDIDGVMETLEAGEYPKHRNHPLSTAALLP